MAKPILSDELWAAIEPLLPSLIPCAKGGPSLERPRCIDGHSLRFAHWHPLGIPDPRDGLRLRYDVLAAAA